MEISFWDILSILVVLSTWLLRAASAPTFDIPTHSLTIRIKPNRTPLPPFTLSPPDTETPAFPVVNS